MGRRNNRSRVLASAARQKKSQAVRKAWLSTRQRMRVALRWLAFFVALAGINLYVFYFRDGTSIPSLVEKGRAQRQQKGLPGELGSPPVMVQPAQATQVVRALLDYASVKEVPLGDGMTLQVALERARVPARARQRVVVALREKVPVYAQEGQRLDVYFNRHGAWMGLDFYSRRNEVARLMVTSDKSQGMAVTVFHGEPQTREERVVAILPENRSWVEALPSEEGAALAYQFLEVFAFERELQTRKTPGDEVELIVEKILCGDRLLRYGKVLFAHLKQAGYPELTALWAEDGTKLGGYYGVRGDNLARRWLRSPVWLGPAVPRGMHIAQLQPDWQPSKRRVDTWALFPAPAHTPVRAMLSGKIMRCPPEKKCTWLIRSPQGQEARYANLVDVVLGIKNNQDVVVGDVLGHVSALPHHKKTGLHISVWESERVVHNVLEAEAPREPGLSLEKLSSLVQKKQAWERKNS